MVINPAGRNLLRPWLRRIPVRVFLDKDPAFTQIAHLRESTARELALEHNAFFSLGANLVLRGRDVSRPRAQHAVPLRFGSVNDGTSR